MDVSTARKAIAWAVHLFTAGGALCGLLALSAIADGQPRVAFAWMIAAVLIDAADGYFARAADVAVATPGYDGALLDNLIDYLNYAIVPAFLVFRLEVVPPDMRTVAAFTIVLASAYQFGQADAKTADHFFRGFPSYWNVAVFYLYYLAIGHTANLVVIACLAIATFVPAKWLYPSRMDRLRYSTLALTTAWGVALGYVLWSQPTAVGVLRASLGFVAYYVALSIYLSRTGKRL